MTGETKASGAEGGGKGAPFRKVALRPGQIVLALEAAGNTCSVALGRMTASKPEILAAENRAMEHGQAIALVPMIAAVMAKAGLAMQAIDAVAVGIGPGGFTGLRIALSTARGLGLALQVPVIGLSSFQASAVALPPAIREGGDIVVLLDSRRSEPYAAWLGPDLGFRATPILLDEAGLAALLARVSPATITGDGLSLWTQGWPEGGRPEEGRPEGAWPEGCKIQPGGSDATALLDLAAEIDGRFQVAPMPFYLREPDVSLPKAG